MLVKIIKVFRIFFFFLFCFFFFSKETLAVVYFSDDFEHDTDKWDIIGNSGWSIKNGMFGIRLNPGTSNAIPKDAYWNPAWTNFIYKVDLFGVDGTDKNITINFVDNNNFYEIHGHEGHIHFDKYVAGICYPPSTIGPNPYNYPLDNGVVYHFKLKQEDHRTKIYLNDTQIFDVIDNPPFLNGKIGLRVGTGGNPVGEVWYDNVIVCSLDDPCEFIQPTPILTPTPVPPTPTPTPPTPMVFVPGLGGSINFKEMFLETSDPIGWRMTPGATVYNNLLKAFEGKSDFYVFYYDWRKPVLETAQKLNSFIKNTVKPWNNKVDLVGHSLGGLVGRTCVQTTENNCYADKLITVGSPHLGVVEAYPAVEAGEIWRTGTMKLALEVLLHYYQKPGETKRETLLGVAPVMKDLLPNFDYLYRDGSPVAWNTLSVQNPLLPYLFDFPKLENVAKTLYGNLYPTLNSLTLKETNALNKILGNWADGEPLGSSSTFDEGDGTVLSLSAKLDHANIENFPFDLDHGGIISNKTALEKIFSLIDYELPFNTFSSLSEEKNYLIFFVHSPVKITLSDLPEDSYSVDELIIIPNPQHKIYILDVTGSDDDYYQLSVGQIYGQEVLWHDYFRETRNEELQFAIDPENPQEDPLFNQDFGTSLTVAINEFEMEIRESSIKSPHQKVLLNFLEKLRKEKGLSHLSFLSDFSSLRNQLLVLERNNFLDRETATLFRAKASRIAEILEVLAFQNPKKTSQRQTAASIKGAEEVEDSIVINNLTKEGALIYLEAQQKLDQANEALGKGEYWQAWIYAQEAKDLFLEAPKII